MAGKLALSVSQLNEYLRQLIQLDPVLRSIELKGEISNLKFHQSGMLFFTMKDERAAIGCVMMPQEVAALDVAPFEGMRVVATGRVSMYTKSGSVQFYADSLRAQGVGVLYERLLALKAKLSAEGLFDKERKRSIPLFPDTIGVVTSPTGAVIHDIMSVSLRRNPETRILLCPARVQGTEAVGEVVDAIHLLERIESVDVIIVARGGGSIEDLWTFNEEAVVRAVAECAKPVISAVGHETDVTLCDLAADLRAPAPSAAAECAVKPRDALIDEIRNLKIGLTENIQARIHAEENALAILRARLNVWHPKRQIEIETQRLGALRRRLADEMHRRIGQETARLAAKKRELALLSPYEVLSRGYAIVMRNGVAIERAGALCASEMVSIRFDDGQALATVHEIRKELGNDSQKEKTQL